MSAVTEIFHHPRLEQLIAELLQELQVVGPSCVQGFHQPDGIVFTETNVRFGADALRRSGARRIRWSSTSPC
ncbi:hypothetical protein AB0N14_18770 [Streptomyces sp. NPDC051104]|uniref:hypothetical protein n=1 Tax=Streptomyces sp. NPDC051104 TaxID=3155044 RepID=UPI0034383262